MRAKAKIEHQIELVQAFHYEAWGKVLPLEVLEEILEELSLSLAEKRIRDVFVGWPPEDLRVALDVLDELKNPPAKPVTKSKPLAKVTKKKKKKKAVVKPAS